MAGNDHQDSIKIATGIANNNNLPDHLRTLLRLANSKIYLFFIIYILKFNLCTQMDLNHRPPPYKGGALTAELWVLC